VPPGSIILAFGMEQYTRDLVNQEEKITTKYGKETIFKPLPPVLLGGSDNPDLVRSILELISLVDSY
jgi:hypothetical protein